MSITNINCSWCQTTLECDHNTDIVAMGWKIYQYHAQLCPTCCIDVDRTAITIDSKLKQYAFSSYFASPGEVIFIANDHATLFIEKKFTREIPLKGLPFIFDEIENGRLHRTTTEQHDEIRRYFGENCMASLAEKSVDAIRAETHQRIETELQKKILPSGKDANIAAVRKMLGMVTTKAAAGKSQR